MKTFDQQLCKYALYHRHAKNIITHLLGIPLIVLAVMVLFSRPVFEVGGISLSPAIILAIITCIYYIKLNVPYGIVMSVLFFFGIQLAAYLAAGTTAMWLGWGIGLFVGGWIIQFIGHAFEGKKPAFVDDLIGLVIGPLFIVVETAFFLGLSKDLKQHIEQNSGCIRH